MKKVFDEFIDDCVLLEEKEYKNLKIIPFIHASDFKTDYISLDTAIDKNLLIIEEINDNGSVPELKVTNKSMVFVLILDGEELVGAKQNRVLNTTVLLEPNKITRVPVSCVEQGRWEYRSKRFNKSNYMMTHKARMKKRKSVNMNLKRTEGKSFNSDQGEVWDEVISFSRKAMVNSNTMAMNDVYEGRKNDLESYLENISIDQPVNGIIAAINGEIVGLEYLSKTSEFSKILPKLLRSYSIDASLNLKDHKPGKPMNMESFLEKIRLSNLSTVKSVNAGNDVSIEGDKLSGAALVYNDDILHFMAYDEKIVEKL